MTNDEARRISTLRAPLRVAAKQDSDSVFVLCHSFVIRHWEFDILIRKLCKSRMIRTFGCHLFRYCYWPGGPDNFVVWVAKQQEVLGDDLNSQFVSPWATLDRNLLQAAPAQVDKQPEPPCRTNDE